MDLTITETTQRSCSDWSQESNAKVKLSLEIKPGYNTINGSVLNKIESDKEKV